jgi:RNA polymerase sigma-70 factor (ECF subfamily)
VDLTRVSDEELVRRWRAGDEEAAGALYGRHAGRLRALARRHIRGGVRRKVGESDLVQDVCVAAFGALERFEDRGPGSFGHWLDRILANKAGDQVKRYVHASKRSVRREDSGVLDQSATAPARTDPGPSSHAARVEERTALRAAIEGLTGDDRLVLVLVHERAMGFAEAGYVMGRSAEATRKLYGRVVLRLAERMRGAE